MGGCQRVGSVGAAWGVGRLKKRPISGVCALCSLSRLSIQIDSEQGLWILQGFDDLGQCQCGGCAVDHAVVASETERHDLGNHCLPVADDDAVVGLADSEDGDLWGVDDRCGVLAGVGADIGDGEG